MNDRFKHEGFKLPPLNLPIGYSSSSQSSSVFVPIKLIDNWLKFYNTLSFSQQKWLDKLNFLGKSGEYFILPDFSTGDILSVIFLVDHNNYSLFGALANSLPAHDYIIDNSLLDSNHDLALFSSFEAFLFRSYSYMRSKDNLRAKIFVDEIKFSEVIKRCEIVLTSRDLTNAPSNILTPLALSNFARDLASKYDAEFSEITGSDLVQEFPLISVVGNSSINAPRQIRIFWRNGEANLPTVTLVGKGITFDTGGLNLKLGSGMLLMKKDMAGAAHVLALGELIMHQKLPVNLNILLAAAENSVSENAFRPGDVYLARNGLSVEITNTDAEGRLVLADLLSYADDLNSDYVIDMATLTGAARVALGPDIVPFYSSDDNFSNLLLSSSYENKEHIWRMPLHSGYLPYLASSFADLQNSPDTPFAGSIIAALFLSNFTKCRTWVHFDIYAWQNSDTVLSCKGGKVQAIFSILSALKSSLSVGRK